MNKKLLETTLKSMEHYTQQLEDLEETKKVVDKVRNELRDSLKEFFPFYNSDIIIMGGKIWKFIRLEGVNNYSKDGVYFRAIVYYPDSKGGWKQNESVEYMYLRDLDNWKKIS